MNHATHPPLIREGDELFEDRIQVKLATLSRVYR